MANKPLNSIQFPNLSDTYTIPQITTDLTQANKAAEAKKVGEELADLKSAIDLGSVTPALKTALLQLASKVAYIDDDGQDYYDDLYDALYNRYWQVTNNLTNCTTSNASEQTLKSGAYSATITASIGYVMTGATVSITMGGNDITATAYSNGVISIPAVTGALVITISAAAKPVSSISAVFDSGDNEISTADSLETLKQYLTVTAAYSDGSTATVTDYTLSGTLEEGTSTITVTYGGKTTTFDVTVVPWLYRLLDTTINNNYIDTGRKLSDTDKDFSIALDVDITSLNGTGAYRLVSGLESVSPYEGINISRYSTQNYLNFRYYDVTKKSTKTFIVPGRVKLVATHTAGSGSMSVKYIGTTGTSTTAYTDTVTGTFGSKDATIIIGGGGTNFQWIGTVHSFYLYNSVLTSAEIDNYLGVS